MQFRVESDHFGRLVCSVSDGSSSAVVTASDFARACDDLNGSMEALDANGIGECYWAEGAGEYRWVFRRAGDRVRVAALWTAGVMTGWEHVFWTECPYAELVDSVRTGLARATMSAA